MPSTSTEPDVVVEFEKLLTEREAKLEGRFTSIEDRVQSLAQRSSRPPVNIGSHGSGGSLEIADAAAHPSNERSFRDWLSTPRGQRSAVTFQTPFKIEKRTAPSPLLDAGGTMHYAAIYGPARTALRLLELIPVVPMAAGGSVEYGKETSFTPGADVVAEGALKPETTITYDNSTAAIKTIATWTKASVQSLADVPGLQVWLNSRVSHAVLLKAESVFMTDLLAAAGALTPDFTPAGEDVTQLDLIASAISQLEASGYTVDGIVLNGVDAAKARLLKTASGEYLWSSPDATVGTAGMWSVPVVISPSMPAGNWLVGAFQASTVLFNRQQLTIEISFENEDDFIRNLCTIRAEERAALAIPVPGGLVKGTFGGGS